MSSQKILNKVDAKFAEYKSIENLLFPDVQSITVAELDDLTERIKLCFEEISLLGFGNKLTINKVVEISNKNKEKALEAYNKNKSDVMDARIKRVFDAIPVFVQKYMRVYK